MSQWEPLPERSARSTQWRAYGMRPTLRIAPKVGHLNLPARVILGVSGGERLEVLWDSENHYRWLIRVAEKGVSIAANGQFSIARAVSATGLNDAIAQGSVHVFLELASDGAGLIADLSDAMLDEPPGQPTTPEPMSSSAVDQLSGAVSPPGRPQAAPEVSE